MWTLAAYMTDGELFFLCFFPVLLIAATLGILAVVTLTNDSDEAATDSADDSKSSKRPVQEPKHKTKSPQPILKDKPMNVDANKLPPLKGMQRYFQMPDGGFIIFSDGKPEGKSALSDQTVFRYFNTARSFLQNQYDEYLKSQLKNVEKITDEFRTIDLPDGSTVMVRASGKREPTTDDMLDLLELTQNILKMLKARETPPPVVQKRAKKSNAEKAFDVAETSAVSATLTTK